MKSEGKIVFAVIVMLLFPGLIGAAEKGPIQIGVPTGSGEGLAYGVVMGLTTIVNREIPQLVRMTTEVSPGTVVNLEQMRQKKVIVALSDTGGLYEAINAVGRYKDKPPLTGVSQLFDMYARETYVLTPKGKPLKSIADLKGKRIHIGQAGSPSPDWTKRWLEGLGINFTPIMSSWADAAEGMQSGQIDACVNAFGSYPYVAFTKVFYSFPVDWYSLSQEEIERSLKIYPNAVAMTVKPGPTMYKGVDHEVRTFASTMGLMAQDELGEDITYNIIKAIMKFPQEVKAINPTVEYMLLPENQVAVGKIVPLHKGTLKYLKEIGALK